MSTQIEQFTKAPNPLDEQDVFDFDMAVYVAETQRFVTQANALGSEMQINADVAAALILAMALPQFAGTSSSSVTIGTGAKSFVTQTGKGWLAGQIVVASSGSNYVKGTVTAYNSGTGALDLNVTSVNGSGTFGSWMLGLSYDGLALAKSGDNGDINRLNALVVGGLPDGVVLTNLIADSAVNEAKLANASVTAAKLSGGQTGSAPVYGARAWCLFNGSLTGTNAPTAGGNISSVQQLSASRWLINFATAMPDANYACLVTAISKPNGGNAYYNNIGCEEASRTTTSCIVGFTSGISGAAPTRIDVAVFR